MWRRWSMPPRSLLIALSVIVKGLCDSGRTLFDALLEEEGQRILDILSKWRDWLKPQPLVQADGCLLVNACLQAEQFHLVCSGVLRQMMDQHLSESPATKLRADIHPLELSVLRAEKLN